MTSNQIKRFETIKRLNLGITWTPVKLQGIPENSNNKTNKNGQTCQACQHSKVVQRGPKGSEMVNLDVFDHLGPFWARLDPFEPFQTKNYFCSTTPLPLPNPTVSL